jgi:aldehyde:ferredoxin oxidoreductase
LLGFHGRYLRIDLTTGTSASIPIEPEILARVIGGVGLGAWLLHRECPIGVDPLAPEAPLIFAFAPLVGTGITTSAKFAVVAKSPLTGRICDALASSHFALTGKALGYDALVFVGACAEPSEWTNGKLRPTRCWGRSAQETTEALAGEGRVAAIGRAGENGVRFATISADGRHAGRGGLGAVMGAKRLKAIVAAGAQATSVAEPATVAALAGALRDRAASAATAKYRELGTVSNMNTFASLGALPVRNFSGEQIDGAERLSGERWQSERRARRSGCAHCSIGCEHRFTYTRGDGERRDTRAEYESIFALGPLCGLTDPDAVLEASERCDFWGLDSISTGATLAFAMECTERGELENGPRFGERLTPWLDRIAEKEGLGRRLAEGSMRFADSIGGDAPDRAPHVKGLELPGYEPRALQAMALGFAVGARGADHNRSGAYEIDFSDEADRLHGDERSARLAAASEDRAALMDALVLCKFVRGAIDDLYAEGGALLSAVIGRPLGADDLRASARRIVDLRKAFNAREGWTPAEDTLPARLFEEPIREGPARGARIPRERLARMIRSYNRERGWSEEGWPARERLALLESELALPGLVDTIEAARDASRAGCREGMERG